MADERDRAARAVGDVEQGALVPLVGALGGAALALSLGFATAARELPALLRSGLDGGESAEALLATGLGLVVRAGLPPLAAALGGALLLGLLQTRGHVGSPRAAARGEPAAPRLWLAVAGWLLLVALGLAGLVGLAGLRASATPASLAGAAVSLGGRSLRAALALLVALALADHLVRRRARRVRLGLDEPSPSRRRAYVAPAMEERMDALVQGVALVLFDEERAIALGRRGAALVPLARARGMAAIALREAARRRGLPLRPGAALERFDLLVLGEPVAPGLLESLEIGLTSRGGSPP